MPVTDGKRPHFTRERRRSALSDERAFGITIERRYLYRSRSLVTALETLQDAIARRDCFAVVTGEPGTGKTTLCRTLVDESSRHVVTALLLHPPATPEDLLAEILSSLGIMSGRPRAAAAPTRDELVKTLQQFLQSIAPLGAAAMLVIDEAQGLSPQVLQEIQLLAEQAAQDESPLQVVLVGQTRLVDLLRAPELKQLNGRLSVRYECTPLTEDETSAYVRHRLRIADPAHTITFAPDALALIHPYSNGVPRLVNLICHRALIAAQGDRAAVVDADVVATAIHDLELAPAAPPRRSWFGRLKRA